MLAYIIIFDTTKVGCWFLLIAAIVWIVTYMVSFYKSMKNTPAIVFHNFDEVKEYVKTHKHLFRDVLDDTFED